MLDPCVGSGRMLLHAGNYSYRLFGTDLDRQVLMVTLINGALYCPWLVRPFPEAFFETPTPTQSDLIAEAIRHMAEPVEAETPVFTVNGKGQGALLL